MSTAKMHTTLGTIDLPLRGLHNVRNALGALVMAEEYPSALGALDRLAALHAEKPGHVYLRAIVLDKIKQRKPALESYERFLSMSNGQSPDEEFKSRQRIRILQKELNR